MGRRKQWGWFAGIAVVIGTAAACSSSSNTGAGNACTLVTNDAGSQVLHCGDKDFPVGVGATLVKSSHEAAGAHCQYGGTRIDVGRDTDGNAHLDANEVEVSQYACSAAAGSNQVTLVHVSPEAPGAHCTSGGHHVESGRDANGNGQLDTGEVTSSKYICDGADGPAGDAGADPSSTLVVVTNEPVGNNCATGGQKVEFGLDDDRDGVLQAGEIDNTSYVCNGPVGAQGDAGSDAIQSAYRITEEPAGPNCSNGGQKIEWGLDDNRDGMLNDAVYASIDAGSGDASIGDAGPTDGGDAATGPTLIAASEVTGTAYACNGLDAHNSIVIAQHWGAWLNTWYNFCPYGAGFELIHWGVDDDGNGQLYGGWWTGESDGWAVVCDGVDYGW